MPSCIGLILHFGAKSRVQAAPAIEDPAGLLTWLARDRAIVHFAGVDEVRARAAPLAAIVRQWIGFL
jgi:hypothetical protein